MVALSTPAPRQAHRQGQPQTAAQDPIAADSRPIVLYDGVCNLCNSTVNTVLALDRKGAFRMASFQSQAGKRLSQRCGRKPDDMSSMVVVEETRFHTNSDAMLEILRKLAFPFALVAGLAALLPKGFRDWGYDKVSSNRYQIFGKTDMCRNTDQRYQERFVS